MSPELEEVPAEGEEPQPPEAAPQPEAEVINHLLFHKSLLAEGDDGARLNAWIAMVKASREGEHLVMVNPFDRAIAIAFQLVIEKHLDPWKLDLVQFTNLYLEQVRSTKEVDLITAGRLIFLAWTVLKLQSDEALLRAEASRHQPQPEPEPEMSWDDIPTDAWLTDDGSYAFTTAVLQNKQAPIDEKVRHRGDRKVTLYELVEAFEEARQEAESRIILDARRREAKALWAQQRKAGVQGAAHKEDLEAEIEEVWGRILRLNGHPIPLKDLHDGSRDDRIKALVSVLFLAREYKVNLWQENFPYGTIFVKNLNPQPHGEGAAPEAAAEELAKRLEPARARAKRRGKPVEPADPAGPAEAAAPKPKGKRRRKAPPAAVEAMPITAQLQVAAAVARALAKALPPEVSPS
jgi:segregation and condensation protein A